MWCFGKVFLYFFVFWLEMKKKNIFEDKCFLCNKFYPIKIQAATNWSSHLKKHQTFQFFSNNRFLCNFQKSHFSEIFENDQ